MPQSAMPYMGSEPTNSASAPPTTTLLLKQRPQRSISLTD